jgi:CHAT domain-containing protein
MQNNNEIIEGLSYEVFRKFQQIKDYIDNPNRPIVLELIKGSTEQHRNQMKRLIGSVKKNFLTTKPNSDNLQSCFDQAVDKATILARILRLNDDDKIKMYIYYQKYSKKKKLIDSAIKEKLKKDYPASPTVEWIYDEQLESIYDTGILEKIETLLHVPNLLSTSDCISLSVQIKALYIDYKEQLKKLQRDSDTQKSEKIKVENAKKVLSTYLKKIGKSVAAKNIEKIEYQWITAKKSVKLHFEYDLQNIIKIILLDLIPEITKNGLAGTLEPSLREDRIHVIADKLTKSLKLS